MAERCRASASSWDRFRIPSSKAYSPGLAKHTASINADIAAPMPRPLSRVANGARHQNDATATSVKEANQVADNASAMRPKALASTGCATTPSTPKSAPAPLKRDLIDKKSERQTKLFLELQLNKSHPQHVFWNITKVAIFWQISYHQSTNLTSCCWHTDFNIALGIGPPPRAHIL